MKKTLGNHTVWQALCICGLLYLTGCSSSSHPVLYPVTGTVTLDGEPLVPNATPDGKPLELDIHGLSNRSGYILFFEPAKKVSNFVSCEAYLDTRGRYQLRTTSCVDSGVCDGLDKRISDGAPLGWYKVTIGAVLAVPKADTAKIRKHYYLNENATRFSIKVVKNPEPGRYDIKLESDNSR